MPPDTATVTIVSADRKLAPETMLSTICTPISLAVEPSVASFPSLPAPTSLETCPKLNSKSAGKREAEGRRQQYITGRSCSLLGEWKLVVYVTPPGGVTCMHIELIHSCGLWLQLLLLRTSRVAFISVDQIKLSSDQCENLHCYLV